MKYKILLGILTWTASGCTTKVHPSGEVSTPFDQFLAFVIVFTCIGTFAFVVGWVFHFIKDFAEKKSGIAGLNKKLEEQKRKSIGIVLSEEEAEALHGKTFSKEELDALLRNRKRNND